MSEFSADSAKRQCLQCLSIKQIARRRRNRLKLLEDLGGQCVCCGEKRFQFLQIDHMYDNGNMWRRKLGRQSLTSTELRQHISELQVLCANCHNAKSQYGACPHIEVPIDTMQMTA